MKTFFSILTILFLIVHPIFAQQDGVIDDPGDIMIVGYSFVGLDGFSFLVVDDIPNGQSIRFTDDEWSGTAFPNPNDEGEITWTNNTGSTIAAGTVVNITDAQGPPVASIGTVIESDLGFSLASTDELYAYTGSQASPTFLTFFSGKGNSFSALISGTGLTAGTTALFLDSGTNFPNYGTSTDNLVYSGSTVHNGTLNDCLQALCNPANWDDDVTTYPSSVPTGFSGSLFIAPEPEIVIRHNQGLEPEIPDGSTEINFNIGTEFFTVCVGGTPSLQNYLVQNVGTAPLNITGSAPTLSNTTDFNVVLDLPFNAVIGVNGSTNFIIKFDPATPGIKNCTVTINSDDADEDPYTFEIQGIGIGPNPGDIIITEIMQNPDAVNDSDGEWFEVYNTTNSAIDMNGMVIKDNGSQSHTINNGGPLLIQPMSYLVFAEEGNTAINGGITADYDYPSTFTLTNSDDEIILESNCGTIIDQVFYDGGPNFPNPTGASMSLNPTKFDHNDNDIGANWCEVCTIFGDGDNGTPGTANTACPCTAPAGTRTWTGSVDTDWGKNCNWTPNCVPTAADDVVIPDVSGASMNEPVIDGTTAAACKSVKVLTNGKLTVQNGGSLTIDGVGTLIDGLENRGEVTNAGTININNTGHHGLDNFNGTFNNSGTIDIDNTASIYHGLVNRAIFNNNTGGNIMTDNSGSDGVHSVAGTFTNNATIQIGQNGGNIGLYGLRVDGGTFKNNGPISISNTTRHGLWNTGSGTFNNTANLTINNIGNNYHCLNNQGNFNNNTGGLITIYDSGSNGIINPGGTFNNNATINIGLNGVADNIFYGIHNNATFNNNNGGIINIKNSESRGILNQNNTFSNKAGASINIDDTGADCILNNTGTFENDGTLNLGQNGGNINGYGLFNESTFNLNAGSVHIDGTNSGGIYNKTGTFTNEAVINIGQNGGLNSGDGILNSATFTNQGCTSLIHTSEIITNSSVFNNEGTIVEEATGNSDISSNTGVVQNLNGGIFTVGSGNAPITTTGHIWTGCVNTDWDTPGNWQIGTVPSPADNAIIPDVSNDPIIGGSTAAACKSVKVLTDGNLTVDNTSSLTIDGSSGSGLWNEGAVTISGGDLVIKNSSSHGLFNNGGTLKNNGGIIDIDGTGADGIKNQFSATLENNGGTIYIDDIGWIGINNNGTCSVVNDGIIHIGQSAGIVSNGIYNGENFHNKPGGVISIDDTGQDAIFNLDGTFTNEAEITIGANASVGNYGILNRATFDNNTDGDIAIEETINIGLYNEFGTFTNEASITIGANKKVGNEGLLNSATFNNNIGGNIVIEETAAPGLYNLSGTFTNEASISIGANKKVGGSGLFNNATFNNNTGGNIAIEETVSHGLYNYSGTFTNEASINIGQNGGAIGNNGINNLAAFGNNGGEIIIDNTTNRGIQNFSQITNTGTIDIGVNAGAGNIQIKGIENQSVFDNDGGELNIKNTGDLGFHNTPGASTFTNRNGGVFTVSFTGNYGIYNRGNFNNLVCSTVQLEGNLNNGVGPILNEGLFTVNTSLSHVNSSTITNNGIFEIVQLPSISGITNNEIIIEPTIANGCEVITPAFNLGSPVDFIIHGVFTDATGNNSAGAYDVGTNTFTPTVPLAEGTYDYFVKIEDPVGGCTRIVLWQLTTQNCCELVVTCPPSSLGTIACNGATPMAASDEATFEALGAPADIGDDFCGTLSVAHNDVFTPPGNNCNGQTMTRTYTISDDNTTNTDCVQTLTVSAPSAPSIVTCPSGQTIEWPSGFNTAPVGANTPQDPSIDPAIYGTSTATADCGQGTSISYQDVLIGPNPANCPNLWVVERTWTATDDCGRTDVCLQTFTFTDTTPPSIVTCPTSPASIEWPIGFNIQPVGPNTPQDPSIDPSNYNNIVYSDNGGVVSVDYQDVISGPNPGDCPDLWTVTRTWTVTDACGLTDDCDQVFTFTDTTDPWFTFCPPSPVAIEWSAGFNTAPVGANTPQDPSIAPAQYGTATATDNCGNPAITYQDVIYGPVPQDCPNLWTVTRTWTATDACGGTDVCVQTFTFSDTTPPVMATCPPNHTVEGCGPADIMNGGLTNLPYNTASTGVSEAEFNAEGGAASDNCTIVTYNYQDVASGICPTVIARIWTLTDYCGQTATCTQAFTIDDTTAPTVGCMDIPSIDLTANGNLAIAPAQVHDPAGDSDNCGTVNLISVSPNAFSCLNEGGNTVTLTAQDICGNQATCTATVTINPFFTSYTASATDETCADAGDGTITATATALGGQMKYSIDGVNFQLSGQFNNLAPGTYTVTFKVFGIPAVCVETATVTVAAGQASETCYKDSDGDGYTDGNTVTACNCPPGYKKAAELVNTVDMDCNDYDPAANVTQAWYKDADNDGYTDGTTQASCVRPTGYKLAGELANTTDIDCNDSDPAINHGATEVCNGIDDNCNGEVDEGTSGGLAYVGNVAFTTQAQVDAWSACYSVINGSVTIAGAGINNLGPLSNIVEITGNLTIQSTGLTSMGGLDALTSVGGTLTIYFNSSLATLNGLDALDAVGGALYMYYNFQLNNCCAIEDLVSGGVTGPMVVFFNKVGCNSVAEIQSTCPGSPLIAGPSETTGNAASIEVQRNIQGGVEYLVDIYPNPVSSILTVDVVGGEITGTIQLSDIAGRVVLVNEMVVGQSSYRLDVSMFNNGLYFVTVKTAGQGPVVKRIIIE